MFRAPVRPRLQGESYANLREEASATRVGGMFWRKLLVALHTLAEKAVEWTEDEIDGIDAERLREEFRASGEEAIPHEEVMRRAGLR